ncbi:hypothetical protein F4778DRAFT_201028 [Xylariomycetidae sp. FL2044]|nr:hypothetical protein F4778DRAFT_201028 [Xylariomycetidae sp. FL2044]
MQANLLTILAIGAAFSTVQSAPVESTEGQVTQGQVNETQVNGTQVNGTQANAQGDAGGQQICYREEVPHISRRGKEGDLFAQAVGGKADSQIDLFPLSNRVKNKGLTEAREMEKPRDQQEYKIGEGGRKRRGVRLGGR